jgi:hypothetical protein
MIAAICSSLSRRFCTASSRAKTDIATGLH